MQYDCVQKTLIFSVIIKQLTTKLFMLYRKLNNYLFFVCVCVYFFLHFHTSSKKTQLGHQQCKKPHNPFKPLGSYVPSFPIQILSQRLSTGHLNRVLRMYLSPFMCVIVYILR